MRYEGKLLAEIKDVIQREKWGRFMSEWKAMYQK
jgi:hypothetical protein